MAVMATAYSESKIEMLRCLSNLKIQNLPPFYLGILSAFGAYSSNRSTKSLVDLVSR